jgi:hypothetical protein
VPEHRYRSFRNSGRRFENALLATLIVGSQRPVGVGSVRAAADRRMTCSMMILARPNWTTKSRAPATACNGLRHNLLAAPDSPEMSSSGGQASK